MSMMALTVALMVVNAGELDEEPPLNASQTGPVLAELRAIESKVLRGQGDSVRVRYQNLAQAKPGDAMARVYVAWCSLPSDESWNQLKGLAPVFPENPWIHYGMGKVYILWKMKDQARTEFDLVLKRDPTFFPGHIGLGDLARQTEDWPTAEKHYRAALAISDDGAAHGGLGLALKGQGKVDDAKKELSKGVALWADQPAALQGLLELSMASKDPAAIDAATKLAAVQPKNREARRALADLRYEAGQKAEATKEYEQLVRLGSPDPAAVKRLAELYKEQNDADGEARTLTVLAGLDRAFAEPMLRLAELKMAKGDTEGASRDLQEAITREPSNPEGHLRLGKLKLEQKIYFEALKHFDDGAALEGPAAKAAAEERSTLSNQLKLPKKPLAGSLETVYAKAVKSLDQYFQERRLVNRKIGGALKLRVRIAADGKVEGVEVLDDQLGDPMVTAHIHGLLSQAEYAKKKRETTLEFELGTKKKGG